MTNEFKFLEKKISLFWTIGCLLFYAVTVYHHRLNKGQQKYFVTYKVKWIAFTVYLAIALFLTCGEYLQGTRRETEIG